VIPPVNIPEKHLKTIVDYTRKIAQELHVVGLMNMQYAIENDKVYVLEANPRASRTVPLVSKVCAIQMARIATRLMMGSKLKDLDLKHRRIPHYGVKESVFPFDKYPEVDPVLGPEMRSTGEVLGMADSFGLAFYKAEEAANAKLPREGAALLSLAEKNGKALEVARSLSSQGFKLKATEGTWQFLKDNGVAAERINKVNEGRPNIIDGLVNKEIQLVINTPIGKRQSRTDDSYIRKTAIRNKVPYVTTLAAALATAKGIEVARRQGQGGVKSLQEYHADIV
jgi:carbamoyl-phosphate synthase large subunit